MAKLHKSESRSRKQHKNRYGMKVRGRSIFTIQEILVKKAKPKKKRRKKNARAHALLPER